MRLHHVLSSIWPGSRPRFATQAVPSWCLSLCFGSALLAGIVPAGQAVASGSADAANADDTSFAGWQTMRVIRQEGSPNRLRAADLDGNGREALIVVNSRHARLEIYRWLDPDDRSDPFQPPADEPNFLPAAIELDRTEVPLDQLPQDVHVARLDPDAPPQLFVVVTGPNRLIRLEREQADNDDMRWHRTAAWDLLPGSYIGQDRIILLRPKPDNPHEALISFREGIQRIVLEPNARAAWMEPREDHGRNDWWLADLNHDGQPDLVEWTRQSDLTLRWYESANGRLLPAQPLHDRSVDGAAILTRHNASAEMLLLGGTQQGTLRRYQLDRGEASPLGERFTLALPGSGDAPWCGLHLGDDGEPVLVTAPPDRPQLLSYALTATGWGDPRSYPSVGDVRTLAAPAASPGTLLLLTRDAGDLHVSQWKDGRFSYPKPMPPQDADDADTERRILALETIGNTVWWAQRVGEHLDLYVWPVDAAQPDRTRFEAAGSNTQRARWLGDDRLLVLDRFARSPRLIERDEAGLAVAREPAHLQGADLDQYRLYNIAGQHRPARLADGVLQWLDNRFHPEDQVMLPEGQRLVSYLPLESDHAWVLERGGEFIHRLEPDEAGLPQVSQSLRLPGGRDASLDPALGLLLHTRFGVTRLGPGQPWAFELLQSVDGRVGRPADSRDATIHRVFTTDVTGDGQHEAVLADDQRRQLTVLAYNDEGELESLISWSVYEDRNYPYGPSRGGNRVSEPRTILGLDIDGDGHQDLALLAHDRLILYLGREQEVSP